VFEFGLHLATIAALYGLMALSLNLQFGFAGLVNFGQIALFGAGSYGLAVAVTHGWGVVAGLVLGITFAGLIALFFSFLGRRLGADYWGIATLSVAEIVRIFVINEDWFAGGAQGSSKLPTLFGNLDKPWDKVALAVACWILLGVAVVLLARITTSRFGRALRLMREEPNFAASLGYSVDGLRRQALLIAAVPAAVGGFLFAGYLTFVGPDQLLASETFLVWAMIIIGGIANHRGAVLGGLLLVLLFASMPFLKDWLGVSSQVLGAVRLTLVGGSLLAFLMWRPQGILPERVGAVGHV